jgi:hypothetical protein
MYIFLTPTTHPYRTIAAILPSFLKNAPNLEAAIAWILVSIAYCNNRTIVRGVDLDKIG